MYLKVRKGNLSFTPKGTISLTCVADVPWVLGEAPSSVMSPY